MRNGCDRRAALGVDLRLEGRDEVAREHGAIESARGNAGTFGRGDEKEAEASRGATQGWDEDGYLTTRSRRAGVDVIVIRDIDCSDSLTATR